MPKVSIYLPNELHRRAVEARLPIGKICQAAIADVVGVNSVNIPELLDRQMRNIERIIEVYRSRALEGYRALLAAGVDPEVVFAGLPIAREHLATARELAAGSYPDEQHEPGAATRRQV